MAYPTAESPHKGKSGLRRVVNATRYSFSGLVEAIRTEGSFQMEVLLAVVLVPLALWLGPGGLAKAMMVASVLFVLVVELVNSSIEAVVDRVSLENHPLAKRAKDIGSAAVMISLINAVAVWVLVLFG